MINRLDYPALNGPAIASMAKAKGHMSSIGEGLRALVELRVSQINGCTYCIDLHAKQALKAGESQQRLDGLTAFAENTVFNAAEIAALAWAESITLISVQGAPERLYSALFQHYSEVQIVDLTLIIAQMNAWNRLAISFEHEPD